MRTLKRYLIRIYIAFFINILPFSNTKSRHKHNFYFLEDKNTASFILQIKGSHGWFQA